MLLKNTILHPRILNLIGKMSKYNYGDEVSFILEGKPYKGTVYIIDEHGTFENPDKVSYDIMTTYKGAKTLVKHVLEECLI